MFLVKSLIIFLIVLIVVLFALSNAHYVPLHFVVGGPVNVKAIYLALVSYLLGVASAVYVFLMFKIHARRKRRAEKESGPEEIDEETD